MTSPNDTFFAQTITPGKQGVRINRLKYEQIRDAILNVLQDRPEIAFKELTEEVQNALTKPFDGSVTWYTTTVKLDLEFRGTIERVPGKTPQHLRLARR